MKRYVPWLDILTYGGLALVAVAACVVAAVTVQEWDTGKIVALTVVPAAFVLIAVLVLVTKFKSRPRYVAEYKVGVWTNVEVMGNYEPSRTGTNRALRGFVDGLPKLIEQNAGRLKEEETKITSDALIKMLDGATIEWRWNYISLMGIGWTVKDKAGLQRGKAVMVKWERNIFATALYHELLHMVDEVVLGREPDYRHENKPWWDLIPDLKKKIALQYA